MSRNYDNWERLVAAVLKREQFRQLCHLDSISTVCSDSDADSIYSADGGIVFCEDCNLAFDLEDLMTASVEVLGKGTFGTTFMAVLQDATEVAVKSLRGVIDGRSDFEKQMEVVGSIRHENVAPLRAYYYSKDEKLMLYDFYHRGSVSAQLHGKRGEKNMVRLDWKTRLKIGIGAARGIARIHTLCGGKLVHGNIKSSNIFLNSQLQGCVCDVGLAALVSPVPSPLARTEYRAPEGKDTNEVSQASDVYSYGVFLLELLTGKSQAHLFRWVKLVVCGEWTREVFDVELSKYSNVEEEMVSMLQVAKRCLALLPEERPSMSEVVSMLLSQELTNKIDSQHQDGKGKIVYFEGCNLAFDVEDLLRYPGELLGKGPLGTTYKAAVKLEDATTVVVKRISNLDIAGRMDFERQMEVVGNIRHENVAPLRAYYYSKDDKLIFYDFYYQGSVSRLLHDKGSGLNWERRVKIAVGAARGIAHIHAQSLIHGNIKSSNIFINPQGYGCVSELGFAGTLNEKDDVFSFGLLLLQLVTVESSMQAHRLRNSDPLQLEFLDRNALVVDELDMIAADTPPFPFADLSVRREMMKTMQVAKRCLAMLPEVRPSMSDVLLMVDNIARSSVCGEKPLWNRYLRFGR